MTTEDSMKAAALSLALMMLLATSTGRTAAAEQPETAAEVVVALIEAIRDGDCERAETLHVADSSRWQDGESFEKRTDYYRSVA